MRAQPRSPWTDGTAFGAEACRRRDLRLFVTFSQICVTSQASFCKTHGTGRTGIEKSKMLRPTAGLPRLGKRPSAVRRAHESTEHDALRRAIDGLSGH